jgi:hypothetical protein
MEKIHTSLNNGVLLQKGEKQIPTTPPPFPQRKKDEPCNMHVQPFHWLHAKFIPITTFLNYQFYTFKIIALNCVYALKKSTMFHHIYT